MATFLGIYLFISTSSAALLALSIFTMLVAYTARPDSYIPPRRGRPRF